MGPSWSSPWGGVGVGVVPPGNCGSVAFNWVPSWSFLEIGSPISTGPPARPSPQWKGGQSSTGSAGSASSARMPTDQGTTGRGKRWVYPGHTDDKITGCRGQKLIEPMKPNFVIQIPRVRYVQRPQSGGEVTICSINRLLPGCVLGVSGCCPGDGSGRLREDAFICLSTHKTENERGKGLMLIWV